jgi:hypothetical protein
MSDSICLHVWVGVCKSKYLSLLVCSACLSLFVKKVLHYFPLSITCRKQTLSWVLRGTQKKKKHFQLGSDIHSRGARKKNEKNIKKNRKQRKG